MFTFIWEYGKTGMFCTSWFTAQNNSPAGIHNSNCRLRWHDRRCQNRMNLHLQQIPGRLNWPVAAAVFFATHVVAGHAATHTDEARVTKIVRDVRLLPENAAVEKAALNEKVKAGTGVRTGDQSRSELTFVDLTIERLGSNTLFSFGNAGRKVELESGAMLLRVPKNSGGAELTTPAVTVGITGTTVILEATRSGRNKLTVLEGGAQVSLIKFPHESVHVRAGQVEDVPPGATKLPPPQDVDVNDIMNHHPLITDFSPLPSRDLIYAGIGNQPSPSQPAGGGPHFVPPIIGSVLGLGPFGGNRPTRGGSTRPNSSVRGAKSPGVNRTTTSRVNKSKTASTTAVPGRTRSKPSPSPTPRRKQGQ
jgi:hypothetical protein